MRDIFQILKETWGYDAFRPLQEEIIQSVLGNKDTFALMPTGGGKSLCYQVPALSKSGLCLVITPLIALMKDQVENLRKKNITAFAIYSGMNRSEVINTLKVSISSNCRFLYVSPERLETSLFKEYLPGMHVNLIAVDEAHCISQWGYDFRPPYLRIAALRDELPGVPVLALTASATPEVQSDICEKLHFSDQNIFRQSFERINLSYSVFEVDSKINKIIEILTRVGGSAIVYCKSRKRTREIAELLQLQNISASFYHAGLSREDRNQKQEDWVNNRTRVIVSTNAFGMGIDKPDVRVVIHADVPDSLENYYQEAGRAGRDGRTSYAVLLYDEQDITELNHLPGTRYPSLQDIRKVYGALVNFLQVPVNSGAGVFYDFDLRDFIRKFKLNSHTALFSLKALEQEGWLSFNENVFKPSVIRFTTTKETLYEFEKAYPGHDIIIKSLLRAYEGIFDFPVAVSETLIASLTGMEIPEVKNELSRLHQFGILDYQPQKDSPQVYFLTDRVQVNDLSINMQVYNNRKDKFIKRTNQIIYYIRETIHCRSMIIGNYFGDHQLGKCGICDNCLRQKVITVSKEEFENIAGSITRMLEPHPLLSPELISNLGTVKKEKAWKVIEFLQAENKIEVDNAGWIRLK